MKTGKISTCGTRIWKESTSFSSPYSQLPISSPLSPADTLIWSSTIFSAYPCMFLSVPDWNPSCECTCESTYSCETSWMTELSIGLVLKRFFLMVLRSFSLRSWSEEQMMWMGEVSMGCPSIQGQVMNCGSFQPGRSELSSSSSRSPIGSKDLSGLCQARGQGCCCFCSLAFSAGGSGGCELALLSFLGLGSEGGLEPAQPINMPIQI